jgi:hypothetical protein
MLGVSKTNGTSAGAGIASLFPLGDMAGRGALVVRQDHSAGGSGTVETREGFDAAFFSQ